MVEDPSLHLALFPWWSEEAEEYPVNGGSRFILKRDPSFLESLAQSRLLLCDVVAAGMQGGSVQWIGFLCSEQSKCSLVTTQRSTEGTGTLQPLQLGHRPFSPSCSRSFCRVV
ncbi:unnamed protein product [Pleuronectes platessa]|uniref:Uncharacterized protein n=1 Tax=Pleuronectes platessa TaxID=8262 RepID=A0A9N7YZ63_PLEPL|nr:unnamed protein product [Pleuronectes platessa]